MDYGFGLTFKDSLQIWWHFANQSRRCRLALAVILAVYSTVTIFATPLFWVWLTYYFSLTFIFKRGVSLQIDGLPINSPLSSVLWFLIVIEPRLRAIDTLVTAYSMSPRETEYRDKSLFRPVIRPKLTWWFLYNVVLTPLAYVKHINLWVALLHNNIPGNSDKFSALAAEYLLQNFG